MKRVVLFLFVMMIAGAVHTQNLDVDGDARISVMNQGETAKDIVVRLADSTLGVRDVGSLIELSVNGDTLFAGNGNFLVLPGLQYLGDLIPPAAQTVQERLDNGESPLQLYNDSVSLDSLYGKVYQGGLIFYIDVLDTLVDIEGFVAADFDVHCKKWGCVGFDCPAVPNVPFSANPSGPGAELGDGVSNTAGIRAQHDLSVCGDPGVYTAATETDEYSSPPYSDWFLPSIRTLQLIRTNLFLKGHGNFSGNALYWSSTEIDINNAYAMVTSTGTLGQLPKDAVSTCNFGSLTATRAVRIY